MAIEHADFDGIERLALVTGEACPALDWTALPCLQPPCLGLGCPASCRASTQPADQQTVSNGCSTVTLITLDWCVWTAPQVHRPQLQASRCLCMLCVLPCCSPRLPILARCRRRDCQHLRGPRQRQAGPLQGVCGEASKGTCNGAHWLLGRANNGAECCRSRAVPHTLWRGSLTRSLWHRC